MAQTRRLDWPAVTVAVLDCGVLAIACLLSYWLVTYLLARLHSVSAADDLLGGLWAVIATVFVCRFSYHQSMAAALSRMSATCVSFAFCLAYLIFLPFHLGPCGADRRQRPGSNGDGPARRRHHGRDHHRGRHGLCCPEPAGRLAAARPPAR